MPKLRHSRLCCCLFFCCLLAVSYFSSARQIRNCILQARTLEQHEILFRYRYRFYYVYNSARHYVYASNAIERRTNAAGLLSVPFLFPKYIYRYICCFLFMERQCAFYSRGPSCKQYSRVTPRRLNKS